MCKIVRAILLPFPDINYETLTCLMGRVTFTLCPTGRNFSGTVKVSLKLLLSSSLSETFYKKKKSTGCIQRTETMQFFAALVTLESV